MAGTALITLSADSTIRSTAIECVAQVTDFFLANQAYVEEVMAANKVMAVHGLASPGQGLL